MFGFFQSSDQNFSSKIKNLKNNFNLIAEKNKLDKQFENLSFRDKKSLDLNTNNTFLGMFGREKEVTQYEVGEKLDEVFDQIVDLFSFNEDFYVANIEYIHESIQELDQIMSKCLYYFYINNIISENISHFFLNILNKVSYSHVISESNVKYKLISLLQLMVIKMHNMDSNIITIDNFKNHIKQTQKFAQYSKCNEDLCKFMFIPERIQNEIQDENSMKRYQQKKDKSIDKDLDDFSQRKTKYKDFILPVFFQLFLNVIETEDRMIHPENQTKKFLELQFTIYYIENFEYIVSSVEKHYITLIIDEIEKLIQDLPLRVNDYFFEKCCNQLIKYSDEGLDFLLQNPQKNQQQSQITNLLSALDNFEYIINQFKTYKKNKFQHTFLNNILRKIESYQNYRLNNYLKKEPKQILTIMNLIIVVMQQINDYKLQNAFNHLIFQNLDQMNFRISHNMINNNLIMQNDVQQIFKEQSHLKVIQSFRNEFILSKYLQQMINSDNYLVKQDLIFNFLNTPIFQQKDIIQSQTTPIQEVLKKQEFLQFNQNEDDQYWINEAISQNTSKQLLNNQIKEVQKTLIANRKQLLSELKNIDISSSTEPISGINKLKIKHGFVIDYIEYKLINQFNNEVMENEFILELLLQILNAFRNYDWVFEKNIANEMNKEDFDREFAIGMQHYFVEQFTGTSEDSLGNLINLKFQELSKMFPGVNDRDLSIILSHIHSVEDLVEGSDSYSQNIVNNFSPFLDLLQSAEFQSYHQKNFMNAALFIRKIRVWIVMAERYRSTYLEGEKILSNQENENDQMISTVRKSLREISQSQEKDM